MFLIWRVLMVSFYFSRFRLVLSSIGLALGLTAQMVEASPLLRIPDQGFQNVVGFNGNEPISGNTLTNRTHEFYDNKTKPVMAVALPARMPSRGIS